MASAVVFRNDDVTISTIMRDQHKNLTDLTDNALSHVITTVRGGGSSGTTINNLDTSELKTSSNSGSSSSSVTNENNKITIATCRAVYPQVKKSFYLFIMCFI